MTARNIMTQGGLPLIEWGPDHAVGSPMTIAISISIPIAVSVCRGFLLAQQSMVSV